MTASDPETSDPENPSGVLHDGTQRPPAERTLQWARKLSPFDARSITVLIDVSNKCNIRCRMCYFHFDSVFHRKAEYLEPASFERLAAKLFPKAHTAYLSAGNEPLTSPYFVELLRIAAPYQVPDLKFLTNALLVTPEIAEAIVTSGVNQVHISIDGATKETYEKIRVGGEFEKLKRGVRLIDEARKRHGKLTPHLQFNVTLMQSNLEELPQFVDLAQELGVTRIAARHLMPYEGLDLESETLMHVKPRANQRFGEFLEYAARSETVRIVNWPDFFAEEGHTPEHNGAAGPQRMEHANGCASAAPVSEPTAAPESSGVQRAATPKAVPGAEQSADPIGSLDLPIEEVFPGTEQVVLSGWALDGEGIERVWVEREPFPGETTPLDEFGLVPLGQARILPGARPDVLFAHPEARHRFRHAFTFTLERLTLPAQEPFMACVHVIAETTDGRTFEVGQRRVVYDGQHESAPPRSCEKPFENVYIDSAGNVYPYPDCQTIDPFGNVNDPVPFEEIWFGAEYTELRTRILSGDPPDMCLNCPNFINRNVDDESFFAPREVESDFRKPLGYVDTPDVEQTLGRSGLVYSGWSLGFDEFRGVRVEIRGSEGDRVLGDVTFHEGTRPDVAKRYRRLPNKDRAGWTFTLTPEDLSGPRDGSLQELIFRAYNEDGSSTVLGRRHIRLAAGSVAS